jgi:hypothetical protein
MWTNGVNRTSIVDGMCVAFDRTLVLFKRRVTGQDYKPLKGLMAFERRNGLDRTSPVGRTIDV